MAIKKLDPYQSIDRIATSEVSDGMITGLETIDSGMMSPAQRKFLYTLIRRYKPRKVVEIGVAAGGSSAVILNAIKDIEESHLYSFDYSVQHYTKPDKKTGYLIEEKFSNLKYKWTLFAGGMCCNFLDKIDGGGGRHVLDRHDAYKPWRASRFATGYSIHEKKWRYSSA